MQTILRIILYIPCFVISASVLLFLCSFFRKQSKRKRIGFFHPYCNGGGGGERVLWVAIHHLAKMNEKNPLKLDIFIFARGDISPKKTLSDVKSRFGLDIREDFVHFVPLRYWWIGEDKYFPRLTLILQSIASCLMVLESLLILPVHIWVDTTGYGFAYFLVRVAGSTIVSYTHYPLISTDMLDRVEQRRILYNNSAFIARSNVLSSLKIWYYKALASMYGFSGRRADTVMVNSSWTKNHIDKLWNIESHLVYPPADVSEFTDCKLDNRERVIVSVGQFRPEKAQLFQLECFNSFLEKCHKRDVKLKFIGGCKNKQHAQIFAQVKEKIAHLGLEDCVELCPNLPFKDLLKSLQTSLVGMHAMIDEHFGIVVVEYMAAGLITLAHNSGGPKLDTIRHRKNGFLAREKEEYAEILRLIFEKIDHGDNFEALRIKAQERSQEFSNDSFATRFCGLLLGSL